MILLLVVVAAAVVIVAVLDVHACCEVVAVSPIEGALVLAGGCRVAGSVAEVMPVTDVPAGVLLHVFAVCVCVCVRVRVCVLW